MDGPIKKNSRFAYTSLVDQIFPQCHVLLSDSVGSAWPIFAILFLLLDVDCFNLYNTHQPDPREERVGVGGQFDFPDRHKLHSSLCEVSGV